MIRRIGVTLLILFILVFQFDHQKREAQAIIPVVIGAAEAISYIATAMVAAGAVGYYTKDSEGNWGGNLYEKAASTYNSMTSTMKSDLLIALGVSSVAGYMAMSKVSGLWDFLNDKFLSSDIVPKVDTNTFDPTVFFLMPAGTRFLINISESALINDPTLTSYPSTLYFYNNTTQIKLYTAITFRKDHIYVVRTNGQGVEVFDETTSTLVRYYNQDVVNQIYINASGILYPSLVTTVSIVNNGTSTTPIVMPANPEQLNNATPTTQLTTTAGTVTTPIPDSTALETGANNQTELEAAAAAAAAAAIAAALAAGYSQSAADAAGVAASNAIYAGQSAAAAAAAGAAAALSSTGVLTTDIANTAEGDVLDFSKLKFAANLFTNKFPFSLPWDLKNMVTTFGSGSTSAPQIPIGIGSISGNIDMSRFNSLAAAVRVLELFAFGVGLLFGTRKLLGGAS